MAKRISEPPAFPGKLKRFCNVDGCGSGLSDEPCGGAEYGFHLADGNVHEVSRRQLQWLLFSIHDLVVRDGNFDRLSIITLLNDSERTNFGLQRKSLSQRDGLSNIEFAAFLHRVASGAIHGSQHVDDSCALDDHCI